MESISYRPSCFNRSSMHLSRTTVYLSAVILLLLGFLVGFLAGFFGRSSSNVDDSQVRLWAALTGSDLDPTISKRLMGEIKPENIQEHHRLQIIKMFKVKVC